MSVTGDEGQVTQAVTSDKEHVTGDRSQGPGRLVPDSRHSSLVTGHGSSDTRPPSPVTASIGKRLLRSTVIAAGYYGRYRHWPSLGVRILMYHRVNDEHPGDDLTVSTRRFAEHMEALAASGYRVVTLAAACRWLAGEGELELPVVVLTFDDGYADNFWNAWPVLQRYRLPATIFVATGLIDSDHRMSRYVGGGASDRMMTWVEVRELAASGLIEIGAHTVSHRELPGLSEAEASEEIVASRRMLDERLQRSALSFAYPRGAVNEVVRELVARAGFEIACTVRGGINQRGMDRLMLCRTGISGHDTVRDMLMKASGAFDWIHRFVRV